MRIRSIYKAGLACGLWLAFGAGAVWAAVAPAVPPARTEPELFPDRILAKGKNFEVKESQVEELFLAFKANRATRGEAIPEPLRAQLETEILDRLINTRLFVQRATPADLQRAKEIGDKFLSEQKNQMPSQEAFDRQLLALGMKPEMFRAQVMEQAVVKAVIDREIKSKIKVTTEEIKKYYDEHPAYFKEPELVRVTHILFSTSDAAGRPLGEDQKQDKEKLARTVLAKAKAGADFSKLVELYSEDFGSKTNHGEYVFARAKDDRTRSTVPAFEAAAFSLLPGQISDIVTTVYGYHIIKLLQKIPPRTIPLAEVQDKVRETVLQEQVQKNIPEFVQKMREESGVKIFAKNPAQP